MLLRENGIGELQMRGVAQRAGVGLGTVYTYFATKEALYAAMYAERLDRMLAEIEPELAAADDLGELFVLIATAYRDVYAEFGKELDVLSLVGRKDDLDPATADQLVMAAGRLLAALQSFGSRLGLEEPELALVVLWSTVVGLADHFTSLRRHMHSYTWDQAVGMAARTFVCGLLPKDVRYESR